MKHNKPLVSILLPDLTSGGAEQCFLIIAKHLVDQGYKVHLLVWEPKGALLKQVPKEVELVILPTSSLWQRFIVNALAKPSFISPIHQIALLSKKSRHALPSLRHYLKQHQPNVMIAALPYANILAVWARSASPSTRIIVSERTMLSFQVIQAKRWRRRQLIKAAGAIYPAADGVVCVSQATADDLHQHAGLDRKLLHVIYNPVVTPELLAMAEQSLDHPWFQEHQPPVILAAGRLHPVKDYPTLLQAFALARQQQPMRLVILGEGELLDELQQLAKQLGIDHDVRFTGFVTNPFQYMKRAAMLVLSSRFEGLPGVLIQALACGTPVISTDCPGGSSEILDQGRYGTLVPVADPQALAQAILHTLHNPMDSKLLKQRSLDFHANTCMAAYEQLCQ